MRLVAREDEILVAVVEDALRLPGELQCGCRVRLPRQLLGHLVDVVVVDVRVAGGPDELAQLQTHLLCNHHRQ